VDDSQVARLKFAHSVALDSEIVAMEERNRASQTFTDARVELSLVVSRQAFDQFKQTGRLAFHLTPNSGGFRPEWSAVTVREVLIAVPGAKTKTGALSVVLVHNGAAWFHDSKGERVDFTHWPRTTAITYNIKDGNLLTDPANNLGGESGKYAYLSPFGAWTLLVLPDLNEALSLNRVKKVELVFKGYFLPRAHAVRFRLGSPVEVLHVPLTVDRPQ
jgi:hypothetical protein